MKTLLSAWRRLPDARHDAVLRQLPLFHTLTRRERGLLDLILHERTYVAGEVIFEESEEGLGMYIVLEGKVKIVRKTLTGRRELGTLAAGDSFGEMALLDGVTRSASAIAEESPTRLLSLFRPELLRLLHSHSRIGYKISYEMACGLSRRYRAVMDQEPGSDLLR